MLIADFPISKKAKNSVISAGYKSEEDFRGKFLEDIKEIDGLGNKGVTELREYLHSKFGIVLKLRPKEKKIQDHKAAQKIVDHLLKHKPKEKIYWGKEMMTANKLLGIYSLDILLSITPDKKIWTLTYYFTEAGRKYIRHFLPSLAVIDTTPQQVSEPVVEEVELKPIISKPKSIRDFLKC